MNSGTIKLYNYEPVAQMLEIVIGTLSLLSGMVAFEVQGDFSQLLDKKMTYFSEK